VLSFSSEDDRKALAPLAPRSLPQSEFPDAQGFFSFTALIYWKDFPPADALNLTTIFIAVDLVHGRHLNATTAPRGAHDILPHLARLTLAKPPASEITVCQYPLADDGEQGWYSPARPGSTVDIFSLQNQPIGYQYSPFGLSPLPVWTRYFQRAIATAQFICGPPLTYSANGMIFDAEEGIDPSPVTVRTAPGSAHTYLLKAGPALGSSTSIPRIA